MKVLKSFIIHIFWPKQIIKDSSIVGIKNLQLYRVLLTISVLAVPLMIVNSIFAIEHGLIKFLLWHLALITPIILCFIFYFRLNYNIKLIVLLVCLYSIASYNIYLASIYGAGLIILLSIVSISTLFFDLNRGLRSILISIIILFAFKILFVNSIIVFDFDIYTALLSKSSWVVAIISFLILALTITINFGIIQKSLIKEISERKLKEAELVEVNRKLQEEILIKEGTYKELVIAKEKAEESNKLKEDFLHNMTHEVRTPLNGIIGFSKLLNKNNLSEEKRLEFSNIVLNSSFKLQKLIEDILEISVLETKQIKANNKEFDINELMIELYEIFNLKNDNKSLKIVLSNKKEECLIISDQLKIHKILSNIIENALKFTENGLVEFGYKIENKVLKIYVKDTGIGISKENQAKIFMRFTQECEETALNYGGLGLGLCIAKENTSLLKGTIYLNSEKGKGTTFFIDIPIKLI